MGGGGLGHASNTCFIPWNKRSRILYRFLHMYEATFQFADISLIAQTPLEDLFYGNYKNSWPGTKMLRSKNNLKKNLAERPSVRHVLDQRPITGPFISVGSPDGNQLAPLEVQFNQPFFSRS